MMDLIKKNTNEDQMVFPCISTRFKDDLVEYTGQKNLKKGMSVSLLENFLIEHVKETLGGSRYRIKKIGIEFFEEDKSFEYRFYRETEVPEVETIEYKVDITYEYMSGSLAYIHIFVNPVN